MNKCIDCEYYVPKYRECECPEAPYSRQNMCSPDDCACCEYFEKEKRVNNEEN